MTVRLLVCVALSCLEFGVSQTRKLPEGEQWYPEESNLVLPGFNRALVPFQLEHRVGNVAGVARSLLFVFA